jgi:hypothetical protein
MSCGWPHVAAGPTLGVGQPPANSKQQKQQESGRQGVSEKPSHQECPHWIENDPPCGESDDGVARTVPSDVAMKIC